MTTIIVEHVCKRMKEKQILADQKVAMQSDLQGIPGTSALQHSSKDTYAGETHEGYNAVRAILSILANFCGCTADVQLQWSGDDPKTIKI